MTKKRLSDLIHEEVNLDSSATASDLHYNPSGVTKVQLETQVDELTAALDAAKQEIASLQAQIAGFESVQTELAEQTKLVEKLYTELQKAESVQTPSSEPPEAKLTPTPPPARSRLSLQLTNRYVAPVQPTSDLSNEDIGWFD